MPGGNAKPPKLEVYWTSQAEQDRKYWQKHDRRLLTRIDRLIADIQDHPFTGIGKPQTPRPSLLCGRFTTVLKALGQIRLS